MQSNKYLQGLFGLLTIALIIFVGAEARNALQQYGYIGKAVTERDTIAISGMGKVSGVPDVAVLNFGVTSDAKTVNEAQQNNTSKMNAIIVALKGMNIEAKDIQTSNYSIYPRYDYSKNTQQIIGYTVSQSVTVKVRNLDQTGAVLAKAGDLGMNQAGGINFTIDDPQSLQADARDKAIDDATQKAKALADKLGLHLVKVVTFAESNNSSPTPIPLMAPRAEAVGGGNSVAPDIQSGSLDVISNVSITYEVR